MLPGIGISEIFFIIVVAFIALKPKQLHQIAYHAGRYWHKIQNILIKINHEFIAPKSAPKNDIKKNNKRSDPAKGKEEKNG